MTMRMHSFTSPFRTTFITGRSRNRPKRSVCVVVAKASLSDENSFKRRDSIKTNAKKKGGAQNEQKFDWENDFGDEFVPAGKAKKNKKKQTSPAKAMAPPSPVSSTPPSTPPPPPSPPRREREGEEREEVKETPAVAEADAVAAQATTGQADEEEEEEEEDEFAKKKRLAQEKKAALLEAKKREYELAQKEAKEMAEQATMAQAKREEEERASAAAAEAEQTEQAEKEREEEEIRAAKEKDAAEKAKVLADAAKAKEAAAAAAATAAAAAPAAQTTTNETEEKPTTQKKNKEDYMIPEHLKDIFSNDKKRSLKRTAGAVTTGVRVENIKKTFTQQEVLTDVTWDCKKGERVGLVGWNGAGKTTQLKIIMGEIEQDEGEVLLANNVKIGYLTQEFEVKGTNTVREEFLASFGDESEVLKNLERVQKALEDNPSAELTQLLVDKLNELQRQADRMDLFNMERLIDKIMPELGFVPEDNDRLVSSFSGGWQMRISVGKILLQEPGLLLLDEPTNHIDLNTIQWLESYLKNVDVPLVCVSHDREFLDQICNKIVEVERGVATTYKGNYSDYRREKETKAMQTYVAWEKWNKEVSRQRELIQRLAGGGQSGRATAAQKALDKLMEDPIMKPWEEKSRRFRFPDAPRSSQIVAQVRGLSHGYDEKTLFQNVNLQIDRSERVAMIGDNGCGKSTMMRLIQGKEAPKAGEARLGDKELCKVNYFYQNQAEDLDGDVGVLETLVRAAPDEPLNQLKALLGRMAFNTSYHDRPVNFLSGGEKARLALAKFMVTPANVLFLDEPTNHLDIPSKQMLEEALQSFEGTVLAISHDRFFLRQIATRVLAFDEGKITDYEGDYAYYLSKNDKAGSRDQILTAKKKEIEKTQIVSKSKMSKAEKAKLKKEKAKAFGGGDGQAKVNKNAGRWN
jgi:ATPase subunit of ABC transporter with duplicated ATPase domains